MKSTAIISLLLFSKAVFSQQATTRPTPGAGSSNFVTKIVRVRYGLPQKIAELIMGGTPVSVRGDNQLRAIVIVGDPNMVASVEQTIRELDVPAAAQASKTRDIELIVSVVGGSDKTELLSGGQIPEAMAPVIKQLRAVFPYKSYQLLSSMLLRSSEGAGAMNRGVMKSLTSFENYSHPSVCGFSYERSSISSGEDKQTIHIQNFQFKVTARTQVGNTSQSEPTDVALTSDIDLREGQKIVAGKANIDSSDLALFVVLTAKIIE